MVRKEKALLGEREKTSVVASEHATAVFLAGDAGLGRGCAGFGHPENLPHFPRCGFS